MVAVILFILLCIGLYFIHVYYKKQARMNKHYRELSKLIDYKEFRNEYARESIKNIHPGRTRYRYTEPTIEEIRKYFKTHPDKLAETEQKYKEREKQYNLNREYIKRDLVKSRVFAYDYEDMLFQIYAPYASDNGDSWMPGSLSKEYVVQAIAKIKDVSEEEAINIFQLLIENNVICNLQGIGVVLDSMLWDDYNYKNPKWNVVSDIDMTLTKWMNAHGYKHKNETLNN